jgi:flagellar basal-body rod modification protein FlgD
MFDGISNINANTTTSQSKGKSILGKDDFLKMMLAQLKNQDPLNPMDGTEYAAQLAQFSSLEQLSNMNSKLESSINANYQLTQSINNTMTAALIGKEVKLDGKNFTYKGQDKVILVYNLPANADNVTIKIYDKDNVLVKTIEDLSSTKGDHKLSWDFTDNNGTKVNNGDYRFEVEATKLNGDTIKASQFKYGRIDSIKFSESGAILVVNGAEYFLSDVLEIINPTTSTNNGDEEWKM